MDRSRMKDRRWDSQNTDPSNGSPHNSEKWQDEPQADSPRLPPNCPNHPPEKGQEKPEDQFYYKLSEQFEE